jgi:hypothetical protein
MTDLTPLPVTTDEIVDRIKHIRKTDADFFGVRQGRLLPLLDYENASQFFNEKGLSEERFNELVHNPYGEPCQEAVFAAIVEYLNFAWEKANNCRGISSSRSMEHFRELCWAMGWDDIVRFIELEDNYTCYGKPALVLISSACGVNWKHLDSGVWANYEGDESIDVRSVMRDRGLDAVLSGKVAARFHSEKVEANLAAEKQPDDVDTGKGKYPIVSGLDTAKLKGPVEDSVPRVEPVEESLDTKESEMKMTVEPSKKGKAK